MRPLVFLLIVTAFLAGCTPSGCRRQQDPALMPADSTSRAVAEQVAMDSLELAWRATGPEAQPLQFPRTVRFLPDGDLVVSDAQANVLHRFDRDGTHEDVISIDGLDVPYLAGTRGDTLVVFSAGSNRIDIIVGDKRLPDQSVLLQRPSEQSLAYVAATDTAVYAKVVGTDIASLLGRVAPSGHITPAVELPGPFWRHAGFLRIWGDRLVSLTGYRPVVDLLPLSGVATQPDTLALRGFDSPMLERSYRFLQGDVDNAPVLSASAAPVGDRLFVLNLRPESVRVDVFGADGQLQHVLAGPGGRRTGNFYPRDLDVRIVNDTIEIAVVSTLPTPEVLLYRVDGSAL